MHSATVMMRGEGGGGNSSSSSDDSLGRLADSAQAVLETREELDELRAAVEATRDEASR